MSQLDFGRFRTLAPPSLRRQACALQFVAVASDNLFGTLLLVRHGQSQVMANGTVGGPKGCTGLTELGRKQAEALRDRFAAGFEPEVDVVCSSPLPRAFETTQIVLPALAKAQGGIVVREELEEMRLGAVDGITWEQARERFEWVSPDDDPYAPVVTGGESRNGFRKRVAAELEKIVQEYLLPNPGTTVFIGCHGGVVAAAVAAALGVDPEHHGVSTTAIVTSITQIDVQNHNSKPRWVCTRYNDAAHLDKHEIEPLTQDVL